MKQETIRLTSDRAAAHCAERILNDTPHDGRYMVEIREYEKIRTQAQNSRYWRMLTDDLKLIRDAIDVIVDHTGYSPWEVRLLCAKEIPAEQVGLLYCYSEEAAHEALKIINGVPTTTRLGTKKFMEFEERMLQTLAEVRGAVQAVERIAS